MRKQTWFLLFLAVAARCLSLFALNSDPSYMVVPRSFIGGAILTQPGWLDLSVTLVFIITLWTSLPQEKLTVKLLIQAALDAFWILAFPLLTGLTLFLYIQRWLVTPMLTWMTLLRWIQFVLAFVAINMFMDSLSAQNRWARRGLALLLTGALAFTQDVMLNTGSAEFPIVALLSSPGLLLGLTALALRQIYRRSPSRAALTAVLVGGVVCFLVVAVRSDSVLTLFVPSLALFVGALTIRNAKPWPRWIALGSFVSVGLLFSLLLPRLLPPEIANVMAENNFSTPAHTETVGSLTVSYDDPSVRETTVRMARVLESANEVSRETFGVSPEVKKLTVSGIAPGGFHAEFPDGIVGNFVSERFLQLALDKAYLNAPERSASDVDPVNMILHEYAHLYGIVPYEPWIMGPEEEGWATYAATRLSLRLYEKYGAELWYPPYDYAQRARAITTSNLQGHPLVWSHPFEFGGFKLWYALGERDGEEALFRKRWDLTQRDGQNLSLMKISNPESARKLAEGFGETDLVSLGKTEPVRYDQAISQEEYLSAADMLDTPTDQVKKAYEQRANQMIQPGVTVPQSTGVWDAAIALGVFIVGLVVWRQRSKSA